MKIEQTLRRVSWAAMSLVELLIVIAILATVAALLIPYVSPIKDSANVQVARQQQAEVQTALGNWLVAQSSGPGGLAAARSAYNGAVGPKLQLLQSYLQAATYSSLSGNGNTVTSSALASANAYLEFSEWVTGEQPTVLWLNQ
jgi:type II secretory pathway pseudopilin PulG